MFEGITILTENTQMPDRFAILIFFSIIGIVGACIMFGCSLSEMIHKGVNVGSFVWTCISLIIIVGLIICIVAMCNTSEHVYQVMLDNNYPANKLYEQFNVRKVDGLIYTVLEKVK